ncbi:MAG: AbrB/MazE/SpoVT family DNA-binding domain-containing protein [Nitrososphaerota archaeon]|jgi:hypothetical protein|nr:AbrB/MazE/SpoVT family DNA-binding domain-containing protein [Nitrososphaerota archaeon]MDG6932529.1 AbrB/MazE/SpoVT family DNA-binding domain-containing protein [Nitrososphaerota archaeon]MDG6936100.1 AbrB/MazE/SpoVT family DNA-binding domain-containing protein [Nitrososphaerota archaeon]MDG6944536.1 AbrB/MazE/SpoVT family DNA-binding domain-containing protein [Nitrososphaerota archaeon]
MSSKIENNSLKKIIEYKKPSVIGVGGGQGALRVVIPADIAKEYGIQQGDYVKWFILEDEKTKEKYISFKKAAIV